jgi:hypothetical protein
VNFKFGEPRLIKEWLNDYRRNKMKSTIEAIRLSKSKKTYQVMLMGKWYNASLDSGLDETSKGCLIEADVETTEDFGSWLNEVKVLKSAEPAYDIRDKIPHGIVTFSPDRFYMPFVSNVVAHAIAAGAIKDYPAISQWAKAARDAAVALDMLDEPGSEG